MSLFHPISMQVRIFSSRRAQRPPTSVPIFSSKRTPCLPVKLFTCNSKVCLLRPQVPLPQTLLSVYRSGFSLACSSWLPLSSSPCFSTVHPRILPVPRKRPSVSHRNNVKTPLQNLKLRNLQTKRKSKPSYKNCSILTKLSRLVN